MAEMLKSPTRNQKKPSAFLQMFSDVLFCHEVCSTNVTVPTKSKWLSMLKRQLRHCIVECVESSSIKSENHRSLAK